MKIKWLGAFLFVALIAGFGSCYRPYGYHGYSDYYRYGRSHYGHGEHLRRVRGRARHYVVRPDSRRSYYTSNTRAAKRSSRRDRTRW
jgi:hypothetical protein